MSVNSATVSPYLPVLGGVQLQPPGAGAARARAMSEALLSGTVVPSPEMAVDSELRPWTRRPQEISCRGPGGGGQADDTSSQTSTLASVGSHSQGFVPRPSVPCSAKLSTTSFPYTPTWLETYSS